MRSLKIATWSCLYSIITFSETIEHFTPEIVVQQVVAALSYYECCCRKAVSCCDSVVCVVRVLCWWWRARHQLLQTLHWTLVTAITQHHNNNSLLYLHLSITVNVCSFTSLAENTMKYPWFFVFTCVFKVSYKTVVFIMLVISETRETTEIQRSKTNPFKTNCFWRMSVCVHDIITN